MIVSLSQVFALMAMVVVAVVSYHVGRFVGRRERRRI